MLKIILFYVCFISGMIWAFSPLWLGLICKHKLRKAQKLVAQKEHAERTRLESHEVFLRNHEKSMRKLWQKFDALKHKG